jgi:hypothetical protein
MSQEISLPLNRTVRAAVAMLSVSLFSLLTGSAHAQERMYVTLLNNAVVTYDISLASASDGYGFLGVDANSFCALRLHR